MTLKNKIKVLDGTVDQKRKITGSGEQHYYAHRRAAIRDKDFTRGSFQEALKQASRRVTEGSKDESK